MESKRYDDYFSTANCSCLANLCLFKVRVPVGRIILELPAGMLDDDKGDFVGTAVREVSLLSDL